MTEKAVQIVKHFIEKPRKRNSEDDMQEARDSKLTYADALHHLEKSLAHLETLTHSFLVSLKTSEQVMKWELGPRARSLREHKHTLSVLRAGHGSGFARVCSLADVFEDGPQPFVF